MKLAAFLFILFAFHTSSADEVSKICLSPTEKPEKVKKLKNWQDQNIHALKSRFDCTAGLMLSQEGTQTCESVVILSSNCKLIAEKEKCANGMARIAYGKGRSLCFKPVSRKSQQ